HRGPSSRNSGIQRLNILHVCWLEFDDSWNWGLQAKHFPCVYFPDASSPEAFGFLNPACVLCGVYLMPVYHLGLTEELLGPDSVARQMETGDEGKH
ncbi:hypothetical protein BDP27DRAFT_1244966, partial [Rhodocollybia butyracea]